LFLQESPLKIPTQISFAIYQNGSRIFQHGEVNFPLQFHRSLFSDSQTFQLGEERYAVIRPKPISLLTLFIHYTLFFALLFSCITLLFLLVNLRTYLRFVKVYFYTFRFRLYFLFFLTVFLLLFLYILLSPYLLKRYYYTTLKSEIVKKLESVQKRLEQELPHLSVLRNPQAYQYYIALNDFTAVYDLKGHLINARFPLFFRPPYFSHLISASVFQHSQYEQRWIESAPFGGTLFFSGYAVLFHKSRPIGYLWLLYPMENPELEKELNTTIALLFSIVFLFGLFLFTVSFSLSEQLVKPIRLLKFQLIRTVYGHERRPIPWRGKDEMASLIHAYNRMLQLLEESEQQLQLKARESAWQRIAQQIAHEIKNPLTPMKLSLQHLLRQLENPKHQQLVNTVLRQIENLHQIANTFSDFAKRLEHRKPLTKEPVRLSEILQEILALFSHHQTITMRLQNDIQNETFLEGNRADLQRAFLNLIQNAIQAIENEGTITVHLQEKEEHYLITIQDTGMGIPEEIRPHIFEPNFTTKSSGMGLGLAITKQIIEQHQGTITYETKVGHGTSFIIALPKKR
jgi:signal transduction histidine kinase